MPSMTIESTTLTQTGSGSNAAVALTFTGVQSTSNYLTWLVWSYSNDPTGGKLTIAYGSKTIEFDITKGGPGSMFLPDIASGSNTTITVTLAAGGSGIVGKLSILGRAGA